MTFKSWVYRALKIHCREQSYAGRQKYSRAAKVPAIFNFYSNTTLEWVIPSQSLLCWLMGWQSSLAVRDIRPYSRKSLACSFPLQMSISSNQRWQFRNNYWHGSLRQSLCYVLLEPSEIAVEGMCRIYISPRNFSCSRLTRAGSTSFLVFLVPTKGTATSFLNFWTSHVVESLVLTPVPVLLPSTLSPHAHREAPRCLEKSPGSEEGQLGFPDVWRGATDRLNDQLLDPEDTAYSCCARGLWTIKS